MRAVLSTVRYVFCLRCIYNFPQSNSFLFYFFTLKGNCIPDSYCSLLTGANVTCATWIGNGKCNDGSILPSVVSVSLPDVNFNCLELGCDGGDCGSTTCGVGTVADEEDFSPSNLTLSFTYRLVNTGTSDLANSNVNNLESEVGAILAGASIIPIKYHFTSSLEGHDLLIKVSN